MTDTNPTDDKTSPTSHNSDSKNTTSDWYTVVLVKSNTKPAQGDTNSTHTDTETEPPGSSDSDGTPTGTPIEPLSFSGPCKLFVLPGRHLKAWVTQNKPADSTCVSAAVSDRPQSFGLHSPDQLPACESDFEAIASSFGLVSPDNLPPDTIHPSYNPRLFCDGGLYLDPDIIGE